MFLFCVFLVFIPLEVDGSDKEDSSVKLKEILKKTSKRYLEFANLQMIHPVKKIS